MMCNFLQKVASLHQPNHNCHFHLPSSRPSHTPTSSSDHLQKCCCCANPSTTALSAKHAPNARVGTLIVARSPTTSVLGGSYPGARCTADARPLQHSALAPQQHGWAHQRGHWPHQGDDQRRWWTPSIQRELALAAALAIGRQARLPTGAPQRRERSLFF